MKTKIKTTSKYVSAVMAFTFLLLGACDIKIPAAQEGQPSTATPSTPAPEASKSGTDQSDPIADTPVAPASFCVSHELRDVYANPIPYGASALYVVLVHEGVSGRTADPKCLTTHAVVLDGKTYIPCAVPIAEGAIYSRTWQDADRDWIKPALEREAEVQSLLSDASVQVSIETVGASSKFFADSALMGKSVVVLTLKVGVTFSGYCD